MVMPGGWHYIQNGFKIEATDSFDQLIEHVTDYRVQNKLPIGDVVKDVTEWICTTFPRQCNIVNTEHPGPIVQNDTQAYLDAITQWANIKSKGNPKLVDAPTAERRAYTCAHCPNNKDWDKQGCKSCLINMSRLMTLLRQGKEVPTSHQLGGCTQLNHDNRTAVWLEENNTAENLPGHCWCRKSN